MEEIINSTDLYQILSLDKSKRSSLTSTQITKAYRRRAVQTHPDKLNGDRRAFDKVSEAYDILSDETKRKIYDRYGLEAVKDPDFAAARFAGMSGAFSGMSGSFHDHILKSFFGATYSGAHHFSSSRKSQPHAKNHDLRYELEVSLEDMYKGTHTDIQISQPGGPRMVQVDIPRGIVPGSTIRLPGMVDHVSTATPGDVIFIIRQRAHNVFTRKGHDLAMEINISLSEAINGFEREIVHLDGRRVRISSPRETYSMAKNRSDVVGDEESSNVDVPVVIQNGDVHVLKGEGMPKRTKLDMTWSETYYTHGQDQDYEEPINDEAYLQERCEMFGDLYVQYVVEMPNAQQHHLQNLSLEERETLARLLDKLQGRDRDGGQKMPMPQSKQSHPKSIPAARHLQKAKASDFGRASGIATPMRDDDGNMMDDLDGAHDDNGPFSGSSSSSSSSSRTFHQYFTSGGPFFSRGSFPFMGSSSSSNGGSFASHGGNDEGDVQCQQM